MPIVLVLDEDVAGEQFSEIAAAAAKVPQVVCVCAAAADDAAKAGMLAALGDGTALAALAPDGEAVVC